ncbi:MAG: PD40 domain-containing protein [Parcubacteria group bacterium]|nr:PD40 domain-containing protein [Parcubacteria group bacterium]
MPRIFISDGLEKLTENQRKVGEPAKFANPFLNYPNPKELNVFVEGDSIYVASPDGKTRYELREWSGGIIDRSPDGRKILVPAVVTVGPGVPSGGAGMHLIDITTGDESVVAGGTGTRAPWGIFSPVDDRIIITGNNGNDIWILQNKDLAVPIIPGSTERGEVQGQPAWSPDGKKLAFTLYQFALTQYAGTNIFTVDIPPASFTREEIEKWDFKPRQITFNERSESPSWTPDGKLQWETVTYEE